MRVAFVDVRDPKDVDNWSGTPWHMVDGLRRHGVEVVVIGPLRRPGYRVTKALTRTRNALVGTPLCPPALRTRIGRYDCDREPYLVTSYARQVAQRLRRAGPLDVIVTPGSIPTSRLVTDVPVIVWTDATVGTLAPVAAEYYGRPMSRRARCNAERVEASCLARAAVFAGASAWARDGAVREYGHPAAEVVPFGANLYGAVIAPRDADRAWATARRPRLLIVGVDWRRKGVDTAIAATGLLREAGLDAHLDVVGCLAPDGSAIPAHVTVHGTLDKAVPHEAARLRELYSAAHLFLFPSRAEAFGVVLCEAAAHGLPAVVRRTCGVESVVVDGVTGRVVDPTADATTDAVAFAHAAHTILTDRDTYTSYARAARERYERTLNWDVATRHLLALAEDVARVADRDAGRTKCGGQPDRGAP